MTPTASAARDWLQDLVRGLVPEPDGVTVQAADVNGSVELTIHAPPHLRGRIIGRSGKTISLVRGLAFVFAQTAHISRIVVNVYEPERSPSSHVTAASAVR